MTTPSDQTFGGTNVPAQYQSQILVSAQRWNISPSVLAAQLSAESNFNPNAVSSAGAVGIAQFLPATAKSIGVDPYNPNAAIDGMAQLDARYLKQFGSIDKALAAYNAGPGAVSKYGGIPPYAETQNYVKKILAAAGNALTGGGGIAVTPVGITDPLASLTSLVTKVQTIDFWKRTGVGSLGLFVIVVGLYFAMKKEAGSFNVAKQIEGVVK